MQAYLHDEVKGEHLEVWVCLDTLRPCGLPVTQVPGHQCLNSRQVCLDGVSSKGGGQQRTQLCMTRRVLDHQQVVLAQQVSCSMDKKCGRAVSDHS